MKEKIASIKGDLLWVSSTYQGEVEADRYLTNLVAVVDGESKALLALSQQADGDYLAINLDGEIFTICSRNLEKVFGSFV